MYRNNYVELEMAFAISCCRYCDIFHIYVYAKMPCWVFCLAFAYRTFVGDGRSWHRLFIQWWSNLKK